MADEIDDVEAEIAKMQGLENSWIGRVVHHLRRSVLFLRARANVQATRLQQLEDRVAAIESRLPPI